MEFSFLFVGFLSNPYLWIQMLPIDLKLSN
uniref:Uncharacterized protein n=1 Tax=Arundo donax TaxID=35708 RepID=A0A0A8YS93_ARUDO